MTGQPSTVLGNLSKLKFGLAWGISHDYVRAEDIEVGMLNVVEPKTHSLMILILEVVVVLPPSDVIMKVTTNVPTYDPLIIIVRQSTEFAGDEQPD